MDKSQNSSFRAVSSELLQIIEIRRETLLLLGALMAGFAVSVRMVLSPDTKGALADAIRTDLKYVGWFLLLLALVFVARYVFMFYTFTLNGVLYARSCPLKNAEVPLSRASSFPAFGVSACCVYLSFFLFLTIALSLLVASGFSIILAAIASVFFSVGGFVLLTLLHGRAVRKASTIAIHHLSKDDSLSIAREHHLESLLATRKDLIALTGFLGLVLFAAVQNIHDIASSSRLPWLNVPVFPDSREGAGHLLISDVIVGCAALSLFVTSNLVVWMYCHLSAWERTHLRQLELAFSRGEWLFSYVPNGFLLCWLFAGASAYILYAELPKSFVSALFLVCGWSTPVLVAVVKYGIEVRRVGMNTSPPKNEMAMAVNGALLVTPATTEGSYSAKEASE